MTLPVQFLRAARREFDDAGDWYEQRRAGLGVRFVAAVNYVLNAASENAERYPEAFGDVREGCVSGFPYCVYYREEMGKIVVISVFHTARDPAVWQARD